MSTHPAPPASTTPARASASSWSGVRASACWAASTAASHTSASVPPASAASTAAAAPASATVRIVPSCGCATQDAGRGRPAGEGVGEEEGVDDLGVALDDHVAQPADELARR